VLYFLVLVCKCRTQIYLANSASTTLNKLATQYVALRCKLVSLIRRHGSSSSSSSNMVRYIDDRQGCRSEFHQSFRNQRMSPYLQRELRPSDKLVFEIVKIATLRHRRPLVGAPGLRSRSRSRRPRSFGRHEGDMRCWATARVWSFLARERDREGE